LFKDKKTIRANVAFGYLIMALNQCIVLAFLKPQVFQPEAVFLAAAAGTTYLLIGNRTFNKVSGRCYQTALTALIFFFGFLLIH